MNRGSEEDAAREFDRLAAQRGIVVPPDRRAGVLAGYRDLRAMTRLIRRPRAAEDEPANVFDITQVAREPGQ